MISCRSCAESGSPYTSNHESVSGNARRRTKPSDSSARKVSIVVCIGLTACAAAIGSKVNSSDQIVGACAGTVFRPADWTSQPVKYVRVCQAARGLARMRKVTVYEVRNGGFYALNGCHMGFYSLGLMDCKAMRAPKIGPRKASLTSNLNV